MNQRHANKFQFGNTIGTSRWPDEDDQKPTSEGWRHGVVNNRKVADAFNSHMGYNDKNHGPAAEMVWRLLTTEMDYTTFASTNPQSKDQTVNQDLNIEYVRRRHNTAKSDELIMLYRFITTFTVGLETQDTWEMCQSHPLIPCSGFIIGKFDR